MSPIPITIFTGFLGAGKTTFINQLVTENPDIKFGFIINEFGEVGIDGQLIQAVEDDGKLVELSNGCLCCVARDDLVGAVKKIIDTNKVDYIIIETSGLAEPTSIAETFSYNTLDGKIKLDAIICLIDAVNFKLTNDNYQVAQKQITTSDILILNKIEGQRKEVVNFIYNYIQELNPNAPLMVNYQDKKIESELILDTNQWNLEKLAQNKKVDQEENEEHHHEHEDVDEIVFSTTKLIDSTKLDNWIKNSYSPNIIRAKGFLRFDSQILGLKTTEPILYLFQIAGIRSSITPFKPTRKDFDYETSRIVLIGKGLDKKKILEQLDQITVD